MKLIFTTILILGVYLPWSSCNQKVQTTRTALHVARSLDPDSMETVPVKTKAGEITTIIVKKRQGKFNNVSGDGANNTTTNYVLISKSEELSGSVNGTENKTESTSRDKINNQLANFTVTAAAQNVTASQNRTDRSDRSARVPEPVYISSSMIYVKNEQNANKKSRSLVKLDYDGIPIVTGVRVPDDESDKQVWRNARVINGVLVPYDKSDKIEALNKQKPARKPSAPTPKPTVVQTTDGWLKIGSIIKKPTKLNPTPSESKEEPWNSDPRWEVYKKPASARPVSPNEPQMLQTIDMGDEPEKSRPFSEYSQYPMGLWVSQENPSDPEHKYVTDRILEYIKNINKEEMKRLSVQKFTARDARMLPTTSHEQPAIQSRILHVPGSSAFPNSAMYSPSTQSPSRVSFEEGVRTPVLQYAHPEYGVQSAKAEPTPIDVMESKKDQLFFVEDIHSDRGPFAFEPATPSDASKTITDKRSNAPGDFYQRPKKTLAYFYADKQAYPPNKYYGKYPTFKNDYKVSDYPSTIYYEDLDGRPFWLRIGDSLKEQVQSGIDKMTDLTRPVVEPLVEATHKISQNLGLSSGNRDLSTIREKLGTVSTSSLILPAIGIVAGGAALGLGAVAVGRYLNYDVVKMRNGKSIEFENTLEGAADPTVAGNLESMWAEDNSRSPSIEAPLSKDTEKSSRRRRSVSSLDSDKYLENILQSLDAPSEQQTSAYNYPSSMWSDTPCSKKIFCEAMLSQPEDAASLMDKKIYTFLSLVHPDVAATVAPHLEDVMRSVKTKNCSQYVCPSWRPSKQKEILNGT